MAQVYNIPVTRAFTNLGKIGVGFQLFFFETGTTTKKSVFAEAALTTPLTNPVIADANGYFPQIFMESTGNDYKVVLSDDTDTDPPSSPIFTADPVEVDANDINAFGTRPAQHWGTTTNTVTDYQISPETALADYTDDLLFSLEIHLNSTGAGTLAVEDLNDLGNFLTALNIKKYNGAGGKVDIEADDLQANQTYLFRIDSVDVVVLNPEKPFINLLNTTKATETLAGIAEIATQAEVNTGTDDLRIVTPLKLRDSVYSNMVFLSSSSASNSTSVDITLDTATYDRFLILIKGYQPVTNATQLNCRLSNDGGSSFRSGASDYAWTVHGERGGTASGISDNADSEISLTTTDVSNVAAKSLSTSIWISSASSTANRTNLWFNNAGYSGSDDAKVHTEGSGGLIVATEDNDAIRFLSSSGNITAGTFILYGIKEN